ncbi:MAG: hypothetical protein V4739_13100 [Pseudomonadota bacterium]
MADAAPPPPPITDTSSTAQQSLNDSIAKQQEILMLSMQANTAMAYLQAALSLTGKISGR